jgi:hypothetical protein
MDQFSNFAGYKTNIKLLYLYMLIMGKSKIKYKNAFMIPERTKHLGVNLRNKP